MTDLSPEARRLLGLARRGDDPLESDRVRLNRRMAQRLAVAAGITGLTVGSAKSASGAALVALLGKGVTAGVVLTATTFGLWKAAEHAHPLHVAASVPSAAHSSADSERRPRAAYDGRPSTLVSRDEATFSVESPLESAPTIATVSEVLPKDRVPDVESGTPRVEPASLRDAPRDALSQELAVIAPNRPPKEKAEKLQHAKEGIGEMGSATGEVSTRSAPVDPLQDEVKAFREVQQAMSAGQAHRALSLISEQTRLFAKGALQQERAAARVFALCTLGLGSEAHSEAQTFERRWPRSPMLARVRRACGTDASH